MNCVVKRQFLVTNWNKKERCIMCFAQLPHAPPSPVPEEMAEELETITSASPGPGIDSNKVHTCVKILHVFAWVWQTPNADACDMVVLPTRTHTSQHFCALESGVLLLRIGHSC